MRRVRLFLAVALVSALAAGCGQSDSEKFTDQAEKICTTATKQVNAIPGSSARPLQRVQQLKPIVQKLRGDLSRLNPPSGRKDAFTRYLAEVDELSAVLGEIETAVRSNDQQAAAAILPKLQQVQQRGVQAAKDAGLSKCGQ